MFSKKLKMDQMELKSTSYQPCLDSLASLLKSKHCCEFSVHFSDWTFNAFQFCVSVHNGISQGSVAHNR